MKADRMSLPPIHRDLMEFLEKAYPEKTPDPAQTDREIWMAVGARQLVRHLARVYGDQQRSHVTQE